MKKLGLLFIFVLVVINITYAQLNKNYKKIVKKYELGDPFNSQPWGSNTYLYQYEPTDKEFEQIWFEVNTINNKIMVVAYLYKDTYENTINEYCQKTGYLTSKFGTLEGKVYYVTTNNSVKFIYYDMKQVEDFSEDTGYIVLQFNLINPYYSFDTGLNE